MDEARQVILWLITLGKRLATAESCTGGLLGKLLTDVPGSSAAYLGGVVTYSYEAKQRLLGIDPGVLERDGAVCETVALQMATGIRERLAADFGIGITGNAGPGTDPMNSKVGEIYVACAYDGGCVCKKLELTGDRTQNREASCRAALNLLLEIG